MSEIKSYDLDKFDLKTIIEKEKADLIIHTATCYGRQGENIEHIIKSNIIFPSILIDIAAKNGLKGFINADTSTRDTYSFYSSTKKAFLHVLNYVSKESGLKVVNLRLEYVYGPGDDDLKFITRLIESIIGEKALDASPGMQKRDFIFVEDVVEAFVRAIELIDKVEEDFVTLDIGSGKSVSIRAFSDIAERVSSKKGRVKWGSVAYRKNEIYDSKADIEKTKHVLKWEPRYNLTEGLNRTIEWYLKESRNG